MKSIYFILISSLIFSCIPDNQNVPIESTQNEVVDNNNFNNTTGDSGNNTTGGNNEGGVGDENEVHENETGDQPPTDLPVEFIVSDMNIVSELAQTKMIPVAIHANQFFQNSSVELVVDNSALVDININAGSYITATLNQTNINLTTNAQVNLVLTLNVNSMAPSFNSAANGGTGKIVLRATGTQGGTLMQKEFQINLTVLPRLTVGIISDSVPHGYDKPNQIYTRGHPDGLQIVFQNKTMNFGSNGNGPCIHTTSPLQHCNTNNRMAPGQQYLPPKVYPALGYRKAVFYNHFNNSDNISRYIHFNVAPGDENQ